jgi:hypothetical protein
MSFYIRLPEPPPRVLFEDLGVGDVRWVDPLAEDDRALPPGNWHLYVHGFSTRGVEVCYEGGRLQARILIGSSAADFKLALAITHAAARFGGARVEPEDRESCTAGELHGRFNEAWIHRMIDWSGWALRDLVFEKGMITLLGPIREFHLGPRMVQRLDAGPSAGFTDRLLTAICRMQYLDMRRYAEARRIEGRAPGGKELQLTIWTAGQGFLFPPLPHVCVLERNGYGVVIPLETVPELPKVRAEWADECRLLVEPVPPEMWPVLYAAAICHQVDPTAGRAS